jgi:hypothetical protein
MRKADSLLGTIAVTVGLCLYIWGIPMGTSEGYDDALPPSFFPGLMSIVMIGLGGLLVLTQYWPVNSKTKAKANPFDLHTCQHLGIVSVLMLITYFGFEYLGFMITGVLLSLSLMLYMGARRVLPIVCVSLISTILLFAVFWQLLERPLPKGQWW